MSLYAQRVRRTVPGRVATAGRRQRGAAIIETVVALPVLLALILGTIQFGLIYEAKATLNHAALQAARAGAVSNAQPAAIRSGLARGLVPLYSPESSMQGVAATLARIEASLPTDARVRILNPTREAFEDFAEEVDGIREIPNDRLHARSTSAGAQSGMNIQDANLLRVEITYGYELHVPLVNWFISRLLLSTRRAGSLDAFEVSLLRRTRLPIVATSTVRMQSPVRLSDAMVARADLPDIERIPSDARPPDDTEDEGSQQEEQSAGNSVSGDDDGSSLADGFFGFGAGRAEGAGSAASGDDHSGSGTGAGTGSGNGDANSGSPVLCSGESDAPAPSAQSTSMVAGASNEAMVASTLPSLSVGNPIHVVTGNKYQAETDLAALPGELGLTFTRHYNSDAAGHAGVLGAGWRHSYEASIRADKAGLDIWQADGRHLRFVRASDGVFRAQRASDGTVARDAQGYRWRWPTGRQLEFDSDGRLLTISEHSRTLVITYDATGRLSRVVDPQQRELSFQYFANGRLAEVRGPGLRWRYGYDDKGNLVRSVAADGRARQYEYSDERYPHHLTGIRAGVLKLADYGRVPHLSPVARWAYDEQGRAIFSSHPDAAGQVTLAYGHGYTDVTDAFGRVTRYFTETRDGIALVTQVRGAGCKCDAGDSLYGFDERFQLTEMSRRNEPSMRYRYDAHQRLETIERAAEGSYALMARFHYDDGSSVPSGIDYPSVKPGEFRSLKFGYRDDGQLSWMLDSGFTPLADGSYAAIERRVDFAYDSDGRLVTVDGPRTDLPDLTHIEYDERGRLVSVVTPEGSRYRVEEFDASGRPTQVMRTGHARVRYRYDAAGHLSDIFEMRRKGDLHTHYGYDAAGHLESIEDPQGRTQKIGYDAAGRPDRFSMGEKGFTTALKYAPDGNLEAAAVLGRNGHVIRGLHYVYDPDRHLKEIRDGDGPPVRQFSYKPGSDLAHAVVDALGNSTGFSYDAAGRLQAVIAADGGVTRYERDGNQRLRSVVAPSEAATLYAYDDFGRLVEERSADRGTTRYAYDAAGNLKSRTDARGQMLHYDYDADNRVTRIRRAEGETHFRYRAGRVVRVDDPASAETFDYDDDGQLIRHARRIGTRKFVTSYDYDERGRISVRALPSGTRLHYRYAADGSISSITRESLFFSQLIAGSASDGIPQADPHRQLSYGNGLVMKNLYDAATGELVSRSTPGVADFRYEHDDAGRLVEVAEDADAISYRYDPVGRLRSASMPEAHFTYRYDTSGNRTAEDMRLLNVIQRRGRADTRLKASSGMVAANSSVKDAAGNTIRIANRAYEYDSTGRAVRLFVDGRLAASYAYNASGERISKTIHTNSIPRTTFYLYEDHTLVAETDASGNIESEYIYIGAHPVALLRGRSTFWIHTDHLGTPRAVTDAHRSIVWRAAYDPFGAAHVDEDPDDDGHRLQLNLRFPGQYADAESGTYYNLMRDYDPRLGRYLTPDPLGLYDGVNLFAYVHNNPVSGIDRYGMYDEMVHYYVTYFLALVAGLPQDVARTMAIADQYVDVNDLTKPIQYVVWPHQDALPLYHFVLDYENGYNGDRTQDPLTRIQSPTSDQLTRLYDSTDARRLQELWIQSHPTGTPGMCPIPAPSDINNARYQLYGEYLHAFEDTFAHRDAYNMPYGIESNIYNTPVAVTGHGGPGVPDMFGHAPDHTYNQNYLSRSVCVIEGARGRYALTGLSREECTRAGGGDYQPPVETDETVCVIHYVLGGEEQPRGLSESECAARGQAPGVAYTTFHPGTGRVWAYNELRTLRMEYEVFNKINDEFSDEIARNLESGGKKFTWQDIAGRATWDDLNPEKNARIGTALTFEEWAQEEGYPKDGVGALYGLSTVLQQYNASSAGEESRLKILNSWLAEHELDPIEPWDEVSDLAALRRTLNIGWIPQDSLDGVLLPAASTCGTSRC